MADARLDIVLADDGSAPAPGGRAGPGDCCEQLADSMDGLRASIEEVRLSMHRLLPGLGGAQGEAPGPEKQPDWMKETKGQQESWPDAISRRVEAASAAFSASASNNNLPLLMSGAKAAGEALSMIPLAGKPLQAGLDVLSTAVKAASDTVSAFVERGKQLAEFSPALAVSGARAETVQTMADVREAQELGPALARLTDAQTDAQDAFRELLLPIKKWIVETMAGIMEGIAKFCENAEVTFGKIYIVLSHLPTIIADWGRRLVGFEGKAMKLIQEATDAMLKDIEERRNGKEDALDRFVHETIDGLLKRAAAVPGRAFDPVLANRARMAGGML